MSPTLGIWMVGSLLGCGAKQTAPAPLWSSAISVTANVEDDDQVTLEAHNLTRTTIVVESVDYLVFSSKDDSERSDRLTPGVKIEHDTVQPLGLVSVDSPNRVTGTITWRSVHLLAESQRTSFDLPLSAEPRNP